MHFKYLYECRIISAWLYPLVTESMVYSVLKVVFFSEVFQAIVVCSFLEVIRLKGS